MSNYKTELLPCPFCGKSELSQFAIKAALDVAYVVNCKWCGGRAEAWTEEAAVAQWNTRTPAEDVRAVVDEPVLWFKPLPGLLAKPNGQTYDVMFADVPGYEPLYLHPQRPVVMPEKYDDVLLPFLAMMRAELHANAHKGDRPGWLSMDRKTAMLEVFYHMGKLHQAVHRDEAAAICEYAADVANMCMMLTDVCGCLDS